MTFDPRTSHIRTKSVPNVDTDRLLARLDGIRDEVRWIARGADQKGEIRDRAREAINIERELARRAVVFVPVTDGRHLDVDVWTVREIRPSPGRDRTGMIARPS